MEHMHTDVSVGRSVAFSAAILGCCWAPPWLGIRVASLMADQFAAVWRAMPTAGL